MFHSKSQSQKVELFVFSLICKTGGLVFIIIQLFKGAFFFKIPDSFPFQEVGYQHGKTVFNVWCRSGVLDKMLKDREEICKSKTSDVSVQFKNLCLVVM